MSTLSYLFLDSLILHFLPPSSFTAPSSLAIMGVHTAPRSPALPVLCHSYTLRHHYSVFPWVSIILFLAVCEANRSM